MGLSACITNPPGDRADNHSRWRRDQRRAASDRSFTSTSSKVQRLKSSLRAEAMWPPWLLLLLCTPSLPPPHALSARINFNNELYPFYMILNCDLNWALTVVAPYQYCTIFNWELTARSLWLIYTILNYELNCGLTAIEYNLGSELLAARLPDFWELATFCFCLGTKLMGCVALGIPR